MSETGLVRNTVAVAGKTANALLRNKMQVFSSARGSLQFEASARSGLVRWHHGTTFLMMHTLPEGLRKKSSGRPGTQGPLEQLMVMRGTLLLLLGTLSRVIAGVALP